MADSKCPFACWHQSNVCKARAPFGVVALAKHRGGGQSHTKSHPGPVTLACRWWCFVGQRLRSPQYAQPVGQADKLPQAAVSSLPIMLAISIKQGKIAMKIICLPLLALVVLMMGGCACTTPINNLGLPPVSTIEGNITQLDESGFILADNSGSIRVRAKLADNKKLAISIDEKVKVYGNLQGGQEKIFDGYVIKKSTGEQIIVSNPTPHFGFVIQSAFK
ncbi:MAG: hypothetical protein WAW36_06220 [Methylovulum miyakonense]|uniref:hypothetical protein n=1 Tax=Methylovulum miyakonense TaxID=645578 RepID=UPI003BB6B243